MKVIIIGARGQLGRTLQDAFRTTASLECWNRPQYDITNPRITQQILEAQPDLVINAAAWTNVDEAERNQDAAYAVNSLGPQFLAEGCHRCGAQMVQISTNEVFDGQQDRFYREYDIPNPGSVYARSKLAGEQAVQNLLKQCYIVRVAWLFGPGENNFPSKIVGAAQKHKSLRVVDDEFGNPTCAADVAVAIASLVQTGRHGIYHLVNSGYASRLDFAQNALNSSGMWEIDVEPIPSSEWPRLTTPPAHACLINQAAAALGIKLRPWQEALAVYIQNKQNNHVQREQILTN